MRTCFAFLMVGWLVGCGGEGGGGRNGGNLSFEEMCDQGAAAMCEKAGSCGSSQAKADCIAQGKARNCAGGVGQYCGVGMTFQSGKASACLDALDALACTDLDDIPAACTPEALCASSSGSTPETTPAEACRAVGGPTTCEPQASLCYAAGTASSCANQALCLGDSTGMHCAARCTVDADCLSAGSGLVCLQGCTVTILNNYCVKTKAKAKFMQYECSDTSHASALGFAGWVL